MPFYKALKFLLTTASGNKISRKIWGNDVYITKNNIIDDETGKNKITINYISPLSYDGELYTATLDDMMANDWYIMNN